MAKFSLKFGFLVTFVNQIAVFCASQGTYHSKTFISDAHKTLFDIINGDKYSRDIRPFPLEPDGQHGNATVIKVNISIRQIDRIDDLRMEISTQLTFRQLWSDPRLEFHANDTNLEYITLNDAMADKIWTPHLFFSNEATAYVHNIMKVNSYKRIYPTGNVIWSSRVTLVFSCPMDFKYFPFEGQICPLAISEFSHTFNEIAVIWDQPNPISLLERKKLRYSKFDLLKLRPGSCGDITNISIGQFSCVLVTFYLQRQSTAYIINLYMPSTLFVVLSWIAFWLGPSISARLSLTLTLLLTMTTQIMGANQNLPQVSYMKALDLWTGFLTTMGALAILQTATVAFCLRHDKNVQLGTVFVNTKVEQNQKFVVYNLMARKIDIVSRFLFPLCFSMFVVVYFLFINGQDSIDKIYPEI